ncbi:MAG TPA: CotH kinase family protein [Mucilaginibacter sp.]|nr:CotH kinase family protein [Mucilaginibacter sp.]
MNLFIKSFLLSACSNVLKALLILFVVFLAIAGCKKDKKPADTTEPPVDIYMTFEQVNNQGKIHEYVICKLQGDTLNGVLSSLQDTTKILTPTFIIADGSTLKVNGVVQESGVTVNDFKKPVTYTLTRANGTTKNYTVNVTRYSGLPIFYVTTASPVVSKDNYVTGNLVVDVNDSPYSQDVTSIDLQIKGRGNSTWDMPKKPYRLKFNKKTGMLGFPAAKNWVLLANYADKTLMRNAIAFEMGKQFGADFTPSGRFVEVVMNGEYIGNYYMTQQVEVDPNRINITDIKSTDNTGDAVTGGYLLEVDQRLSEVNYFYTTHGLPINLNTPDATTTDQFNYIKQYIQNTEDAIFAANFADPVEGYAKYINVDSFIDWYLVKEIMKDNDAKDYSSIYYYKDRNGKLGMGPLWDFDLAAGNTDYSDCQYPTGWWIMNSPWFQRLFQDPAFKAKVKAKWNDLKGQKLPGILTFIDQTAKQLDLSQGYNFQRWDILHIYVWPNPVVTGSYLNEVKYTRDWLSQRISWMDQQISTW